MKKPGKNPVVEYPFLFVSKVEARKTTSPEKAKNRECRALVSNPFGDAGLEKIVQPFKTNSMGFPELLI
jgi:hypothetical protein